MKKEIRIDLKIKDGTSREFWFEITTEPIAIETFIQALYKLCDYIIELELSHTTSSCSKGCSACCNQLIPLAGGEVFHLNQLVASFPETKQRMFKKRIRHITRTLERQKQVNSPPVSFENQYFQLGIPCPFLENNACSIYSQRPFVCREYQVNSSPLLCADPYNENIARVGYGVNFGALVTVFCAKLFGLPKFPVPLFQMRKWINEYKYLQAKKFPSEWLFENFLTGIAKGNFKDSVIVSIKWSYAKKKVNIQDKQKNEDPSLLFTTLASRNKVLDRKHIYHLLKQGAVIKNGSLFPPTQLPKRLTQVANAENIKSIFTYLIDNELCIFKNELFIEVGSGDGYLKYLMTLTDDPKIMQIAEKIIETEESRKVVEENLIKGKHTINLSIEQLSEHFAESFTPLIISMNVLDIFSQEELIKILKAMSSVLKKEGIVLHIMSSAIHSAVFEDISKVYPNKLYLPFHDKGYIGVRIASTQCRIGHVYSLANRPEILAELFRQTPDQYIHFSEEINHWFSKNDVNSSCILLYQFSLEKMSVAMQACGFNIIYNDEIYADKQVKRTEFHNKLEGVDTFYNLLGALITSQEESGNKFWLRERATFGVIIAKSFM